MRSQGGPTPSVRVSFTNLEIGKKYCDELNDDMGMRSTL